MFCTANARLLSVFHLNLLVYAFGRMLPRWRVIFEVVMGKLTYLWALCARAVPELCRNAP